MRAVKHKVKKRLLEAVKDLHLILTVFPGLKNAMDVIEVAGGGITSGSTGKK